ncbi:FluC/FEX family fluoride channel [Streptomyces mirabilis]|uniref:FluC/FEX family fluoride channel n=1 Tax=Streptomyces mirabilis TaxID=68239 RepID=UPI00365AA90F
MRADESGPERESREPTYISDAEPEPRGEPEPGGEPEPSREQFRSRLRKGVLAAVALGGVLGGSARYVLGLTFPTPRATFPLTTFANNVSGAFMLALLLVYVVGTWMVDTDHLLGHGHYAVAAFDVFGSLAATGLPSAPWPWSGQLHATCSTSACSTEARACSRAARG